MNARSSRHIKCESSHNSSYEFRGYVDAEYRPLDAFKKEARKQRQPTCYMFLNLKDVIFGT